MNSVNIIGRLTKDPDTKKLQDGTTLCSLRLAIDDAHSKEDRTDFISVTVFGAQGDVCKKYLRKGFLCGVTGRLRSEVYTDQEGVKRYPIKLTADRVQFVQWPERTENTERVENAIPAENANEAEWAISAEGSDGAVSAEESDSTVSATGAVSTESAESGEDPENGEEAA